MTEHPKWWAEAHAMHAAGMSKRAIAKHFGKSRAAVRFVFSEEAREKCAERLRKRRNQLKPAGVKTVRLPDDQISAKTKYNREYQRKYPEKRRAHKLVEYAIKGGRLARGVCERCGSHQTQAHHDDYSRPLDVRWLCSACHVREHVAERAA